jgi:hypothetical protein
MVPDMLTNSRPQLRMLKFSIDPVGIIYAPTGQ